MAYPNDLVRTKDWGNEVLTDADLEAQLDLIINWLMAAVDATTGHKHDATANEGPKVLVSDLNLSSGAEGDIIYRNATELVRLAKGTKGQVLKINDAEDAPEWGGAQISDKILTGFELIYKTTDDVYVEPGSLLVGATLVNKTARTTLTLATAADWWDGAVDSYAGGAGWCYIGVKADGDIKLLGANPPDKADTAGNTVGTLLYWYDSTLYWRVIGAVRVHTDNTILLKFYQQGDWIMYDDPENDTHALTNGSSAAFADVNCSDYVPALSELVKIQGYGVSLGTNTAGSCSVRTDGSGAVNGLKVLHGGVGDVQAASFGHDADQFDIFTASRIFEYIRGGTFTINFWVVGYYIGGLR